jgi:hypothetical protein
MENLSSINLLENKINYFPISLVTIDYDKAIDNLDSNIKKNNEESLHQFLNRLQKIRSDKRFMCIPNRCKLHFQYGTSKDERTLLPRIVENGRILLNTDDNNNNAIMKYSDTDYKLNKIELFGETIFGWNNNTDLPNNINTEYSHDAELHLQFIRLNQVGEFSKDKTTNITIVIGLKGSQTGSPIFPSLLSSQFDSIDGDGDTVGSSGKTKVEEWLPKEMGYFTYLLEQDNDNIKHRIIVMENFRFVDPIYIERIREIIKDSYQLLPEINPILERPLDEEKRGMYGFLKINEEKRGTDYESKVYYRDEIRIQYIPNIIESTKIKKSIDNVEFNLDLPSDYIVMKKENIKPLDGFYKKWVFLTVYLIVTIFIISLSIIFFNKRFERVLFISSFGGIFTFAMYLSLIYVNYSYNYLIENSSGKTKEEHENKKSQILKPIVFLPMVIGMIILAIIVEVFYGLLLYNFDGVIF